MFRPRTLRGYFTLLLTAILAPTLVVEAVVYLNWYHVRRGNEIQRNLEIAHAVASRFTDLVRDVSREAGATGAALVTLKPYSDEQVQEFLDSTLDSYHGVVALSWVSPEGRVVASSDPKNIGLDVSDRPHIHSILTGAQSDVSNLLEGRVSHKPTFYITRAVPDSAGELAGVMVASLAPSKLNEMLDEIERPRSSRIGLFDRYGNVVCTAPALTGPPVNWAKDDTLLGEALAGREVSGPVLSPGESGGRYGARVPIAELGWVAGASRPSWIIFEPIVRSLARSLGVLGLVAALSILAAGMISRKILRVTDQLQQAAALIGKGGWSFAPSRSGIAEFDTLAIGFQQAALDLERADRERQEFVERLRASEQGLKSLNTELERRVEERTASLRDEMAERVHQSSLLEAFFRYTMTPLVFLDSDFNFIRVNEAYARACARDVTDFPGRNHFDLYPSEELEAKFRRVVETGQPYHVFARPFLFPDHPEWGLTYWDLSLAPIKNDAGRIQFLVFSLRDVTEKRQAERSAELTREVQSLFVATLNRKEYLEAVSKLIAEWSQCECVGVRVVDESGRTAPYEATVGCRQEFLAAEGALELSDSCICARVISGKREPSDACCMTPFGSFSLQHSSVWGAQLSTRERGLYRGHCIACGYETLAVVPIRYRGVPYGAIHLIDPRPGLLPPDNIEHLETLAPLIGEAIFRFNTEEALQQAFEELEARVQERTSELAAANAALQDDIAKREQVEAALRRSAEDLARSNRDLEDFAYVASHDLQEPLRVIVGYLQLIERRYKDHLDQDAREFIEFAVDGGRRMQQLIIDLLEYSRVGRRGKPFEAVDCNAVVADVFGNLAMTIRETGAYVRADALPHVHGDQVQITRLLQNLVSNAIKFRSAERPPEIDLTAETHDGEWLFRVHDNGIGIDPKFQERIFMIFERLHSRDKYPGTGIGLAVCKKIVERHGGRIWVESEDGQGATFCFTLPA